jgi:hypothetical protein
MGFFDYTLPNQVEGGLLNTILGKSSSNFSATNSMPASALISSGLSTTQVYNLELAKVQAQQPATFGSSLGSSLGSGLTWVIVGVVAYFLIKK